jgi:hypothetical protein
MDYIKNTFSNLAKQAGGIVSTKQSDLFWTYSAAGIPLATYGLLAATTLVLASYTLSMSGGGNGDSNPGVEEPIPAAVAVPESTSVQEEQSPVTGGKRQKNKSGKRDIKASKTTKRRK